MMKYLFNDYYNKKIDNTYKGVEFVAYDKEYTDKECKTCWRC